MSRLIQGGQRSEIISLFSFQPFPAFWINQGRRRLKASLFWMKMFSNVNFYDAFKIVLSIISKFSIHCLIDFYRCGLLLISCVSFSSLYFQYKIFFCNDCKKTDKSTLPWTHPRKAASRAKALLRPQLMIFAMSIWSSISLFYFARTPCSVIER